MTKTRVLALDFDGVISDSAPESFAVAVRTYASLRPRAGPDLGRARAPLDRGQLVASPLYAGFLDLMPLGNRAEDFAVALWALEHEAEVSDQSAFDSLRRGIDADFLESFHHAFYRERARLRERDRATWLSLLGPYPAFLSLLKRRAADVELAVATAKDRASVRLLLETYGIADLLPDDRVIDKEAGRDKRAHISALRAQLDCGYSQITFVDDKLNHLESVSQLGVRCVLAAWGYNGERERRLAREAGHGVCGLEDAEEALFDPGR